MGHEIAGCLLVKLFVLYTTAFKAIFSARKKAARKKDDDDSSSSDDELPPLSDDKHVSDWIQVASSLLQWHQRMKQPTLAVCCAMADASRCCCFLMFNWHG
jgi:hypothetical protein